MRKAAGGQTRVKLLFVDLAGSERTKKTGVEGSAKAEAVGIKPPLQPHSMDCLPTRWPQSPRIVINRAP